MADAHQINDNQAVDQRGFILRGQIYVPAASVQGFRALYGIDEQADAASNHYAALAVAPHAPLTPAAGNIFYASGTTAQTLNLGMTPSPGAGIMQYLRGLLVTWQVATALQGFSVKLNNLGAGGPTGSTWLEAKTTDAGQFYLAFPDPIAASAAATQIILATTFVGTTTYRVDVALWGFNRAV